MSPYKIKISYSFNLFSCEKCKKQASCRRIFSLDVVLLDAFGGPVSKELEVSDLRLLIVDNLTIITLYLHACCSLHLRLSLLSSMPTMVSLLRTLLMRNLPFLSTVTVLNMLLMRDRAN